MSLTALLSRNRFETWSINNSIPAEKLERIFEQFYRLDPERGTEGSGLGLAIAKHRFETWSINNSI